MLLPKKEYKMTAVDIALEKLYEAQKEIYESYPPPYVFPSTEGRVAQLIADTINMDKQK